MYWLIKYDQLPIEVLASYFYSNLVILLPLVVLHQAISYISTFTLVVTEKEPLTTDKERKAFQLAMRDGVANSLSFRLCVFGPENAGKTCLVDSLFDDMFQQQESTQGADVHVCTVYAANWKKCSPEEMAENIQTRFFHSLNISAKEQVDSPSFQASSTSRKPCRLCIKV